VCRAAARRLRLVGRPDAVGNCTGTQLLRAPLCVRLAIPGNQPPRSIFGRTSVVAERSSYEAAGRPSCTIGEDNAADFGRAFHFAEGPLVY
jgi:hypothetical protein